MGCNIYLYLKKNMRRLVVSSIILIIAIILFKMLLDYGQANNIWGLSWREKINSELFLLSALLIIVIYHSLLLNIYNLIQNQKVLLKELKAKSITDELTDLPNRRAFSEEIAKAIKFSNKKGCTFAILYLDLDRFKLANDIFGHKEGDTLLINVAERLSFLADDDVKLYRLCGDEFIFIFYNAEDDLKAIEKFANRIIEAFKEAFILHGQEMYVTTSIGIARYPYDGLEENILLKNADVAMCRAKENGKNSYEFYNNSMNDSYLLILSLENGLRKAIERDELVLYYQPQIDIKTKKIIAAEALLRWKHPTLGMISPGVFIPIAEDTGLIEELGKWVIKTACRQNKIWSDKGLCKIPIGVNISAKQFRQNDLDRVIYETLSETGLDGQLLEIELTESILMQKADAAIAILGKFKNINISIAVDDFGTGYSSLSYLKKFPIDKLKIDGSFISEVPYRNEDDLIVKAIIALGHSLNLKVIAEGVEREDQIEFLRGLNCDGVQGYKYSPPVPAEEFEKMVLKFNNGEESKREP